MSKRNNKITISKESISLKRFREERELSLRKLADKLNLSFTRVHQMESGRENVNQGYIDNFLQALNISKHEWDNSLEKVPVILDLRQQCHELLDSIDASKLDLVFGILSNF